MTIDQYKRTMLDLMLQYRAAVANHRVIRAEDIQAQYNVVAAETQADFPNESCIHTDPWKWQRFAEQYKITTGTRPKGSWSIAAVDNWILCNNHPTT